MVDGKQDDFVNEYNLSAVGLFVFVLIVQQDEIRMNDHHWSEKDVLLLIKEVEFNPTLWDKKHPDHKHPSKRDEIWEALTEKFNKPASELSRRWLCLMSTYRKKRRRELAVSSIKQKKVRSMWSPYKAMHFLADRYKPSKPIDPSEAKIPYNDAKFYEIDEEDAIAKMEDSEVSEERDETASTNSPTIFAISSDLAIPQDAVIGSRPQEPNAEEITLARSEIIQEEILIFGELLASKLRKLDGHSNAVAQHFINKVLFKAELGQYKDSFDSDD